MKRIILNGTQNTRDLGGTITKYGTVKYGKLIRSGELSRIDEDDIKTLYDLGLTRIIDLRTETEREITPDVQIENVQYIINPIIRSTTFGITYEKASGEEIALLLARGIKHLASRNETPTDHMSILYSNFVNDSFSVEKYGDFMRLLLQDVEGATLWHCTAGKDRVGTCTALLLYILGADKDTIMKDYMFTNTSAQNSIRAVLDKARPHLTEQQLALVQKMLGVQEEYLQRFFDEIDKVYGSCDNFINNGLKLSADDIGKLRQLYLD